MAGEEKREFSRVPGDQAEFVVGERTARLRVAELDELEREVLVDRPYYRGRDVLEMAASGTFEDVAAWLWTGRGGGGETWRAHGDGVAAAVAAQSGLPAGLLPLDRLQLIVTALAATDPLRHHLDPDAVTATGRALIAGLIEALPPAGRSRAPRGRAAERLWSRLCPHPPPGPGLLRAFEAAMILLADHELAASTVAARVAASVRAGPYAVVASGLGALDRKSVV